MLISLDCIVMIPVPIQLLVFHSFEQLINNPHVVYFIIKCHHAFVCNQSKHVVMKYCYPQQASFFSCG